VLAIVVETKYFLPTLAITPHFFVNFFSMLAIVVGFPILVVHVLISLSMSMSTMLYVSTIIVETKYSFPTLVIGIHFSMPTMWYVSTIIVEIEHSSSQPISTLTCKYFFKGPLSEWIMK
jgi:hypothetical protein